MFIVLCWAYTLRCRARLTSNVRHRKYTIMALDLSDTLVVGVTTTSLFDMSESDSVFQAKFKEDRATAVAEYREYMLKHENEPLNDGTGMPLVRALLALNKYQKQGC
jgi:5'-nucleotidase